jgi:hypothetical protein
MGVLSAFQAANQDFPPRLVGESLRRPNCPRCGSILLVAEESRFDANVANAPGRIDHHWACDCGNRFVTSIRLCPR